LKKFGKYILKYKFLILYNNINFGIKIIKENQNKYNNQFNKIIGFIIFIPKNYPIFIIQKNIFYKKIVYINGKIFYKYIDQLNNY
jgi:hypothetical protein